MALNDFIINPKDATRILFGASGKLGPMEFAQGLVAIVAVNILFQILALLPGLGMLFGLIGLLVGLVSIFAWVCIFSKRFHDAGQSGWMTLAAIAVAIVLSIVINMILAPVFGVSMTMDMTSMQQAYGANRIVMQILSTVIVNGALGFYMFRLKPKAV
ncbi:DUF805 domain-containing protein [Maricaulis sp.]|jgi:uncharacterized membrane protein YhaH (DUF805 family)|uniref:DUF805 domain-containing protein n=1 Tax=Maricaulis sp. TaxID=1486257 RepID=UPI00262D7331|nr:DUF805 domain-containing protein [Maricaulis sp.]